MKLQNSLARVLTIAVVALAATASAAAQDKMMQKMEDAGEMRSYAVTVTNLTSADSMEHGQPFSTTVFATHGADAMPWFKAGTKASFDLARIAEEGNPGALLEKVVPMIGKMYGHAATQIPTMPGQSRTTYITTSEKFPMLSAVWMLARTNDGFSGIEAVNLWNMKDKEPMTMELAGWDAGSERNNEQSKYLVAKMGTERDLENGMIAAHTGVKGNHDAPATWNFQPNQVARVTIQRVKLDKDAQMIRNGMMIGGK